jgi:hypothetical protein
MRRPGRETVTGVSVLAGAKDRKGIPTPMETRFPIPGCSLQPFSTMESNVNTDSTIALWHLYAPAGTHLVATDRVEAYGTSYEVFGDPEAFIGLRGKPEFVKITLRKARG